MLEQLSEVLAGDLVVELLKSEPQLNSIQPAIADEVVNPVIIDTSQISPIEFNIDTVQKSLSSPEPLLSQSGLKSALSRSFFNRIDGTPLDDFLLGTPGEDLIFAKEGDDIIIALAGNDIVFGEDGDDIIFGGPTSPGVPDDDIFFGGNGNDTFYGGEGDDLIVGGPGQDTVDYRFLNQGITLEAVGLIDKGSAGVDQIFEVETIIGNASQINSIDASTGNGNASIEADLSSDILSVFGTPVGNFVFTIENFSNVTGTNNKDTIIGNKANNQLMAEGGNDFIGGSAGDDMVDGGSGFDTIDYQNLGQAITLEAAGKVDKGLLGRDLLNNVERIVADGTKTNTIDGSTGTGTASLKVNLAKNSLTVVGTPIGNLDLTVENFVDVIGTVKDDVITGNNSANNITGGKGNDELSGLGGKDTINGVDTTQKLAGFREVDILTGGNDKDLFILGDQKQAYYLGNGSKDLAIITDFKSGVDTIQLNGSLQDYILLGTTSSTSIFRGSFIRSEEILETESLTQPASSIVLDEALDRESLTKPPILFDLIATVSSSINTTTDLVFV